MDLKSCFVFYFEEEEHDPLLPLSYFLSLVGGCSSCLEGSGRKKNGKEHRCTLKIKRKGALSTVHSPSAAEGALPQLELRGSPPESPVSLRKGKGSQSS